MKKHHVAVRTLSPDPSPASGRGEKNKFILIECPLPIAPGILYLAFRLNPNNPLDRRPVIPAQAGIQMIEKFPHAVGQNPDFVCFAEVFFGWIPACAGMTVLIMDNPG